MTLGEVQFAPRLQVDDALDHGAQERTLLGLGLVLRERLHDGDAATAAGEEHRPVGLVDLVHDPPGLALRSLSGTTSSENLGALRNGTSA